MARTLGFALALGAAAPVGAAPAEPTAPGAKLTYTESKAAFAQAMFICLGSRAANQSIKDAPAELVAPYGPASAADRAFAAGPLPATMPMWVSRRLGKLLYIFEPSPGRCEVHSLQLPVAATFQPIVAIMQKDYPEFTAVTPKPVFGPIAYQFEHVENGVRFVFHLEGVETGTPGQDSRVSLLVGTVIRQPASESPPFR